MATLYFLGGENILTRGSKRINAQAFSDAGGNPSILVFSWARASFDKYYSCRRGLSEYFRALGASEIEFAEYSDSFAEIETKTEASDLIYLTGGTTSVLLERMKNKSVDNLLRRYQSVIVGRSAGALVLGNKCIITRCGKRKVAYVVCGFSLVDFGVKVHYSSSRDSQLKSLSKIEKFYAIPEGSAIVWNNNSVEFMNDVYLFERGEKKLAN